MTISKPFIKTKNTLSQIIGNNKIVSSLEETLKFNKMTGKALPYILFCGDSGCGKTTIARAFAGAANRKFYPILAASLENKIDSFIEEYFLVKDVIVFIDEIHQLSSGAQEKLYPVLDTNHNCIIGATTDKGKLLKPFRNRFDLSFYITNYNLLDSTKIVELYCKNNKYSITPEAALEIAKRSRGVGRTIEKNTEGSYRKSIISNSKNIILSYVLNYFLDLEIDPLGLGPEDKKILEILNNKNSISIDNLISLSGIDKEEYKNYIEPFLSKMELMEITPKGRKITKKGKEHLMKS